MQKSIHMPQNFNFATVISLSPPPPRVKFTPSEKGLTHI